MRRGLRAAGRRARHDIKRKTYGRRHNGSTGRDRNRCLGETVTEIGCDNNIVVSQLECGDYIVDDRRSGDTILVPADDLDNPAHADVRAILAQQSDK